MKLVRILFSIVALLLVVLLLALGCLFYFMDPAKIKPTLIKEVKEKTGYQLTMDGRLSWTVYPRLGVNIERLALRAPDQSTPFVELQDTVVATSLMQLLQDREKVEGDLHISEAKLMQLRMRYAHVGLKWQEEQLTLQPMTASFYGGIVNGIAHGSQLAQTPHWDWNVRADRVQIKSLLQDVNGADSKIQIEGVGQLKLTGTTYGLEKDQLINNANGDGSFSIDKGILDGLNINYFLTAADALLSHQPVPIPETMNQTPFEQFKGSFVITNGVAQLNDIVLSSSTMMVNGQGSINLVNQTLTIKLQVTPLKMMKLKGTVPLIVQGDLHHPSVSIDVEALNAQLTKEQIDKVKDKVHEKIKDLPAKADKWIKKIIGQ